eukprot:6581714-Lingulodinium_polyedra.AAC.1
MQQRRATTCHNNAAQQHFKQPPNSRTQPQHVYVFAFCTRVCGVVARFSRVLSGNFPKRYAPVLSGVRGGAACVRE